MVPPKRKGGRGRTKTVVRRIEDEDTRHVCFSKRRQGFFSKASDLAVLTGAHVAALAYAPGGTAFSFGHPSVDSVVERFLAGDGARKEVTADQNKKLEKLHQVFDDLRTELAEVKNCKEGMDEAMAKERAAGDRIAAWVDPNARDMGDEDMAAFYDVLSQVKDIVSERANQVLFEAWHVEVSHRSDVAPPVPPMLFGGSTFEFGSSNADPSLVPPPQEECFQAGMGMQQTVIAALAPPQGFASGIDMQQQMVMEPPAQVVAAGMDMQEMPPPPGFAAGMDMQEMLPPPGFAAGMDMEQMPQSPGFEDDMGMQIQKLLMAMPSSPETAAGLETNDGFPSPYWEDEI